MGSEQTLEVAHPFFEGQIGLARRDITPPVGIYSRMWGCAEHDIADGIHRSLSVTAVAFGDSVGRQPLVLVEMDLGWWRTEQDEWFVRGHVLEILDLEPSRLMLHTTHTHSGPSVSLDSGGKPGGEKVEPYLRHVREMVIEAAREATDVATAATLSWTIGRCSLAANRDLPNPQGEGVLCGFNPDGPADDTVLVGRITTESGKILGTLVNYACHPTTLGGANRLISPDYIGAMRDTVETATVRAPCVFLQGASGELGPRRGYEADPAVADQNGRQLGFAVLSALAGMLPPGQALTFDHQQPSGAPLGIWQTVPVSSAQRQASTVREALQLSVELELKTDLPSAEQLAEQLGKCDDRVARERLERAYRRRLSLDSMKTVKGNRLAMPVWGWRLGEAILVGTPAEAHSPLQIELRRRFPGRAIAVINLVNGYAGYLPPADVYPHQAYQVEASSFSPGCLEKTLDVCTELVDRLEAVSSRTNS
jgi:hypothetical protein